MVEYDGIKDQAEKLKRTLKHFFGCFKSEAYPGIEEDILAATSILVTKVDAKTTIDNLKETLLDCKETIPRRQKQIGVRLIDNLVERNKVFMIAKPDREGMVAPPCTFYKDLQRRTKYWERKVLNDSYVDMEPIHYSLSEVIVRQINNENDEFIEDFEAFLKHTTRRIRNILIDHPCSFKNVVQ